MLRAVMGCILVCGIGAMLIVFQRLEQAGDYRPEAWRSLGVDEVRRAFDATGSRTNFLAAISDDDDQSVVLGVSWVGNGVPWLANLTEDLVLNSPLFLAEDEIRVPRPEIFVTHGDKYVFLQNTNSGEKGGGIYSDFELFDPIANEVARYYRFNFRAGTSFHTRADIVLVNQASGLQTTLRPFDELDARLSSLLATASGIIAGGYVVLDGQFRSVPSLAYWHSDSENIERFIFDEAFEPGSHWIDDIAEINATTLFVVGASTVRPAKGHGVNRGWTAIVDLETGTLTRVGDSFPSRGRILLDHAENGFHVITDDRITQVSFEGQIIWSVENTDTLDSRAVKQFVPRSTVLDQNGDLWVAGSAVNDDWGAWITQISEAGDVLYGDFFGSSKNGPRIVDLLSASDGGVLAIGNLYCKRTSCGSLFARGFLLKFGPDGQLSETERARFDTYEGRIEERNFYNKAPHECTRVDHEICVAAAERY